MQFTVHENIVKITVQVTLDAITADSVTLQLNQAGFGRCFVLQDQLTNLLVDYHQYQQKIKDGLQPEGHTLTCRIAEKRPAELRFEIAPDKMSAAAMVIAAWGGAAVSANELVKAAQEAGIIFGFNKEQLIKLVAYASKAEPGAKIKAVIARGRDVVHGSDSHFEALNSDLNNRRDKPVVHADEKADLRDFGVIPSIKTGEPVIRRHPPTSGKNGMTVTGEVITAIPGLIIDWQLGEGVQLSEQDPDLLVASRDGLPRVTGSGAIVDEVFTVKNVDLVSGHIIFKGSVIVNGDVAEGMKIVAGGNIFVKGFVEGQLLEAGGDIRIGGSVIGHQINTDNEQVTYSTEIKAKGDVFCNLAQYARFQCEGTLTVKKQLMHCRVSAARVYAGSEEKPDGKVIGGFFFLDDGLFTGTLGAPSGSQIIIRLNRQTDPIIEKQNVLKNTVAFAREDMDDARERLDKLKGHEGPQADMKREELQREFEDHKAVAMALLNDIKHLEQQRKEKTMQVQVVVTQQLFAAVEVHFCHDTVRSRREHGPSKIMMVGNTPSIEALLQ